jgi:hypothetical protein
MIDSCVSSQLEAFENTEQGKALLQELGVSYFSDLVNKQITVHSINDKVERIITCYEVTWEKHHGLLISFGGSISFGWAMYYLGVCFSPEVGVWKLQLDRSKCGTDNVKNAHVRLRH